MTGQIEQNQFRLRQFEDGFAAYKTATDARLRALEGGASTTAPTGTSAGTPTTMDEQVRATNTNRPLPTARPTAPSHRADRRARAASHSPT
jgi:hypothetical protein